MSTSFQYFLLGAGCLLTFNSCSKEIVVREYTEEIRKPSLIESAFEGSGKVVTSSVPLIWEVPLGWKTLPADGIRVAAFLVEKNSLSAEITLVILAAQSGSIEDNIVRWIGQLNLSTNEEIINKIILSSTELRTDGMILLEVFDFTILTDNEEETMLVAMGAIADQTLFVKIKGPNTLLVQERTQFFSLLQSIALSN